MAIAAAKAAGTEPGLQANWRIFPVSFSRAEDCAAPSADPCAPQPLSACTGNLLSASGEVMTSRILVFYGSYRSDRMGIRLANYIVDRLKKRGEQAALVDAKAAGLPMLDRMYKEYPKGEAPPAMEELAQQICAADAFVFVAGEYNWGVQPGLKNLTDHFLEEWFWRPAAIASYSGGRLAGTRSNAAWHNTLAEMGMVVISSTLSVGPIAQTLDPEGEPISQAGKFLEGAFPRFADDLAWWTEAAKAQRQRRAPPY